MISADFKIDFVHKKILHQKLGSDTVYPVNELYSYLQDTFDELENMHYDIPILANSSSSYTLINGWSINKEGRKFLKDGILLENPVMQHLNT